MENSDKACENCLFIFQNGKKHYAWLKQSCSRCLKIMYKFRQQLRTHSLELRELDKLINEFEWLNKTLSPLS